MENQTRNRKPRRNKSYTPLGDVKAALAERAKHTSGFATPNMGHLVTAIGDASYGKA